MQLSLIVLALVIIFVFIMGFVFLKPLIVVGANAIVLYFLFLRIYTEIKKYKRGDLYLICGAASILLLVIFGNFLPLWMITTAGLLTLAIVHVYLLFEKRK